MLEILRLVDYRMLLVMLTTFYVFSMQLIQFLLWAYEFIKGKVSEKLLNCTFLGVGLIVAIFFYPVLERFTTPIEVLAGIYVLYIVILLGAIELHKRFVSGIFTGFGFGVALCLWGIIG